MRASLIIRYTIALLFLWFGVQQMMSPESWVGFLPEWIGYIPIPAEMLVKWNGWFEIICAMCLAAGFFTRFVSFILGIHLLGIAVSIGGATGIRDAALAAITLALSVTPADQYCADQHTLFKKDSNLNQSKTES